MPLQKSCLHRLKRISALLKENRYPNSESLAREFRRMAVEEEYRFFSYGDCMLII